MPETWTPKYPAALKMDVILPDGYSGDWKGALDQAKIVAAKLDCYVGVTYARQRYWLIDKDTDVEKLKLERVVIGV